MKVLTITRKILTSTWMEQGRDMGFDHFRQPGPGIWEKQVMGWKFLSYEQTFGETFGVHLRRTGLWASQLFDVFEPDGVRSINFVTVFPQPLMLDINGFPRMTHDTNVIAATDEVLASDQLMLVAQHSLTGQVRMQAVQCPPGCSPNVLCQVLGFEDSCYGRHQGRVYFRYENRERIFFGYDRIGLPAGAFIQLQAVHINEVCEHELPVQQPFREHETLVTPDLTRSNELLENRPQGNTDRAVEPHEDLSSFMQTTWMAAMQSDEPAYNTAVEHLIRTGGAGATGPYPEMLQLSLPYNANEDPVRYFLEKKYDIKDRPVFTVHVWAIGHEIATFARASAMLSSKPYTASLLREWEDFKERQPFWILAIDPQPSPISLRIVPIDLIMLTQTQKALAKRIYIIDVVFTSLPKRIAVIYHEGETLYEIVKRIGLIEVCEYKERKCILYRPDLLYIRPWEMHEVVDQLHGTCFILEFQQRETTDCQIDETSFMQRREQVSQLNAFLNRIRGDFHEVTVWTHPESKVDTYQETAKIYHIGRNPSREFEKKACSQITSEIGCRAFVVEPMPFFARQFRPTVIATDAPMEYRRIFLVESHLLETISLGTVLLSAHFEPLSTARLFEIVQPGNGCARGSECFVELRHRHYEYHHDILLFDGDHIRMFERPMDETNTSSTSCGTEYSQADSQEPSQATNLIDSSWAEISNVDVDDLLDPESEDTNSLFQEIVHVRQSTRAPIVMPQDHEVNALWRNLQWHEDVQRANTATFVYGYEHLQLEARAFFRSRGSWPRFTLIGQEPIAIDFWDVGVDEHFVLTQRELVAVLRGFLAPWLPIHTGLKMAVVWPLVVPEEQDGEENIYIP